jgi:hypothetical protein
MARKTIFVSDLSGRGIDDKDAATVTIRYADTRRRRPGAIGLRRAIDSILT